MLKSHTIFLLLLSCLRWSLSSASFLEDELPLTLTSLLPSPYSEGNDQTLYNTDPITLIFSRPVIALGSDVEEFVDYIITPGEETEVPNNPFHIELEAGRLSGKVRWVTTYIARFDPNEPWVTDLRFTVSMNESMSTYDGIPLGTISDSQEYITQRLSGYISDVKSEDTLAMTDNLWAGNIGLGNSWECPPDAEVTLTFSQEVDVNLISENLRIETEDGDDVAQIRVEACDPERTGCILVFPTELSRGVSYVLRLPEDSRYNEKSGKLTDDIEVPIMGLAPFDFPYSIYTWSEPRYIRYELWLRHGLCDDCTLDQIKAITTLTQNNNPLSFTLERPNKGTLRIVAADLQPEILTVLSFNPSNDSPIKDGYGLSLVSSSAEFDTRELYSFYEHASGNLVFEKFGPNWSIIAQGDQNVQQLYSLIESSADIETTLEQAGNHATGLSFDPTNPNEVQQPNSWQDFEVLELPVPPTASDTCAQNIEIDDPCITDALFTIKQHSQYSKDTQIISVTDLAVSSIVDDDGDIVVWVTRMSSGDPVVDATVEIIKDVDNDYRSNNVVTVIGGGVTGPNGVVTIDPDVAVSYINSPSYHIYVSLGDEKALVSNIYFPNESYDHVTLSVASDRKIYTPEDTVHLKGWLRQTEFGELQIPSNNEGELDVSVVWVDSPFERDELVKGEDGDGGGESTDIFEESVSWSSDFGSFELDIPIPANARYGNNYISFSGIAHSSVEVTISDPRRPTGAMTLSADEIIYRPGTTVDVSTEVLTGTGVPINNAVVEVSWQITYQPEYTMWFGWICCPQSQSPSEWATFELITDENGEATTDFSADEIDVSEGDTIKLLGEWNDPTGALIQSEVSLPVAKSEWTLSLEPSISDPLPGIGFGLYVDVVDTLGQEILGQTVEVKLLTNNYDEDGLLTDVHDEIYTCSPESDGGEGIQCDLTMPEIGEYTIEASVTDDRDAVVEISLTVGKTPQNWDLNPLTQFNAFNIRFDKQNYAIGDVAVMSFHNPFSNVWLLLRWGNEHIKELNVSSVETGQTSVDFLIGQECVGSCSLVTVLSVPRQTNGGLALPVQIPISALYDFETPRSIINNFQINVPYQNRDFDVDITVAGAENDVAKVSPGSSVEVVVDLTSDEDAEICVIVVDKAYLDLLPNPITQNVVVFDEAEFGSFSTSDNRQNLQSYEGYLATLDTFLRRHEIDPWITPNWTPLSSWSKADVDKSDEEFWENHVTKLTNFPPVYVPYEEYGGEDDIYYAQAEGGGYDEDDGDAVFEAAAAPDMSMAGGAAGDGGDGGGNDAARGSESATSGGGASDMSGIEPRDTFEITPFFETRLVSGGSETFSIDLPDNVGTFVVRVYAVDALSRFGVSESELVVTKAITLQPSQPRFVRVGDKAQVGATVSADDVAFDGSVEVQLDVLEGSADKVEVHSEIVAVEDLTGLEPISVTFDMTFKALGNVQFNLRVIAGEDSDGILSDIDSIEVMDPIFVATSMAITANDDGDIWVESLVFPETYASRKLAELNDGDAGTFVDPDASLELIAGVGRLIAIQTFTRIILDDLTDPHIRDNADLFVGILGAEGIFNTFYDGADNLDVASDVELQVDSAKTGLATLTDNSRGLVWTEDYLHYSYNWIDAELNAFAIYVSNRVGSVNLFQTSLVNQWKNAVEIELINQAQDAINWGHEFSNFNLLASAFLALGEHWEPDVPTYQSEIIDDLSLDNLREHFGSLSVSSKLKVCLLYLLEGNGLDDDLILRTINDDIYNNIRIQGRTAYVAYGPTGDAQSMETQGLALTTLLYAGSQYNSNPLVEKLANYISQGNALDAFYLYSVRGMIHSMLSLADYDFTRGTTEPSLTLSVLAGEYALVSGESFTSASQPPLVISRQWTELSQNDEAPEPLDFIAQGSGEVSVSVGLSFVPPIYDTPVYRGIYVERLAQRVDPITRSGFGPPLTLVEAGEFVEITVQITTPDELQEVTVIDLIPAGLEPLDPNLFSGVDTSQDVLYWFWYNWSPFTLPQLKSDRVIWESSSLQAGTYTMTYQALAVTPGIYTWPPTVASVRQQPEVMGMSGGGHLVVTDELIPVADVIAFLNSIGVVPYQPIIPKDCPVDCSGGEACDVKNGVCIKIPPLVLDRTVGSEEPFDPPTYVPPEETDEPDIEDPDNDGTSCTASRSSMIGDNASSETVMFTFATENENTCCVSCERRAACSSWMFRLSDGKCILKTLETDDDDGITIRHPDGGEGEDGVSVPGRNPGN